MSNVAPVDSTQSKGRPLGLGEAVLQGRISLVRKAGTIGFSHLIILPAPDPFSAPSTVEVVAKSRLGAVEEDIRVRVRIAGFRRSYESRDKDTGEITKVQTADNRLFAVEE
ncbi:MAG: hypothetical protein JSR83_22425 [Proteobacteria bacterium]|nr:hypothetical protein [Pseudomonadota bacterium]